MAKPSSISLTILIAELLYSLIIDLTIYKPNPVPICFPNLSFLEDSNELKISSGLCLYSSASPRPVYVLNHLLLRILCLIFC